MCRCILLRKVNSTLVLKFREFLCARKPLFTKTARFVQGFVKVSVLHFRSWTLSRWAPPQVDIKANGPLKTSLQESFRNISDPFQFSSWNPGFESRNCPKQNSTLHEVVWKCSELTQTKTVLTQHYPNTWLCKKAIQNPIRTQCSRYVVLVCVELSNSGDLLLFCVQNTLFGS